VDGHITRTKKKKVPIRRLTVDHCCGGFFADSEVAAGSISEPLARQ